MLSFGNTGYNTALRVGASHAGKAFLGGVQVWPCITEPPPPPPGDKAFRWQALTFGDNALLPHQPGDLLVAVATSADFSGAPSLPATTATAPTWTTVTTYGDGNTLVGVHVAYAIATSSTHTSGNWYEAGANGLGYVFSCRGQAATPIGGFTVTVEENYDGTAVPVSCPAVALQDSSGASLVVHFTCTADDGPGGSATGSPAAGYTTHDLQYSPSDFGNFGSVLMTKDTTTSAEAVRAATLPAGSTITSVAVGSLEIRY